MTDSNATEHLRNLLHAYGIEYEAIRLDFDGGDFNIYTEWGDEPSYSFVEYRDGTVLRIFDCTPQQAIAATLGADDGSRWYELFGTPERAAQSIGTIECLLRTAGSCADCVLAYQNSGRPELCSMDYDALLEWLRGKAVKND